jgi:hypothetical protein
MPTVKEKFTELVKKALQLYINDAINERLKNAMVAESTEDEPVEAIVSKPQVMTTDDEKDAYFIIKAILRQIVTPERIAIRDTLSYCGILLDDNNRKPICRLYFNTSQYYLGIVTDKDKNIDKIPISNVDEIYSYADQIRAIPNFYE